MTTGDSTSAPGAESDSGRPDRPTDGGADDAAARARQLHQQGLAGRDISILLNAHEQQVTRWLSTATTEQAAQLHAARWQERGNAT